MVKLAVTYNRSTELRHFLYRMLAVCAFSSASSYVITFLGITANSYYETFKLLNYDKTRL